MGGVLERNNNFFSVFEFFEFAKTPKETFTISVLGKKEKRNEQIIDKMKINN